MAKVFGYFLKVTQQAPSIEGTGSENSTANIITAQFKNTYRKLV